MIADKGSFKKKKIADKGGQRYEVTDERKPNLQSHLSLHPWIAFSAAGSRFDVPLSLPFYLPSSCRKS